MYVKTYYENKTSFLRNEVLFYNYLVFWFNN